MASASKAQIDRLGERLREGTVSDDDLRELNAYRDTFVGAYNEVAAKILSTAGLEPTGRPQKTPFSIVQKLRRERTMQLSRMQDIAGCRLVVAKVPEQDQLVQGLVHAFNKTTVVDRRQRPSHGYRAVHVIAKVQNKAIEIQVRTELQNLWAQLSEVMSDVFDPAIKYGGGDPIFQGALVQASSYIVSVEEKEKLVGEMDPELVKLLLSENVVAVGEEEITPALAEEFRKRRSPGKELIEGRLDSLSPELATEVRRLKLSETMAHRQFKKTFGEFADAKARLLKDLKTTIERFAALPRKVN